MLKLFLNICFIVFTLNGVAQQTSFKTSNFDKSFFGKTPPLLFINSTNFCQPVYSSKNVNPQTKLPVFCQMEVNLHKRLNVWMVFRAGNDECYRKFISAKN